VPGERKKPLVAPSVPFTFSKSTVEAFTAPCALGEHTEEVLRDWLGLDAAEIASLRSRNAFGAERTN
jgi:succinate--hydroxymethylglutarate CoA-transferase